MCGFLGFVGAGSPINLGLGAERVRRRGPDSMGVWASPDRHAQIHHARLAISDLRPVAMQPITDAASGLTIAFVGEIYNHLELREALGGHFRTDSDTETLLRLFADRGVDAVAQLRGMFAIILVDEQRQRVWIMRDPVGKKPLYLLQRPEGSYFSSSVLALAVASGQDDIDDAVAERWWDLDFTPPDQSLLTGCVPVQPGEVVELTWDGAVAARHRMTPPTVPMLTNITVPEAMEEMERLVRLAVRRRLHDNPNPVALLSGGIDSTVVCKYAVEAGATRLLTLGSRRFKTADEVFAKEAAQRFGVPLEVVMLGNDPMGERVAQMVDLHDEPLGMISFIPMASLARIASTSSRVLLTGDGGDEVFGGYGRPDDWVAKPDAVLPPTSFPSGPPFPAWMSAYGRRAAGFDLVGHGFAKLDRATAEQAVEARCPLLSYDLVTFARSLPKDIFFHKPVSKPMIKGLLGDWPESFVERTKAGFPFRLRGLWLMSFYHGLREGIRAEAQERFRTRLPAALQGPPMGWSTLAISQNFTTAYKLFVWSAFLTKLQSPTTVHDSSMSAAATKFAEQTNQTHSHNVLGRIKYLGECAWKNVLGPQAACPSCGSRSFTRVQRKFGVTTLERCTACQLMFRLPLSSASAEKEFYTNETYDAGITTEAPDAATLSSLKRSLFKGTPKDATDRLELLQALDCDPARTHLLDFGCSWGYTAWQFQAAGYRVTGFEVGRQRCNYAVSQMGITAYANESQLQGPFDVFFCSHVLEHVPSVRETMALARTLVRPGGLIIFFTPNGSAAHRQVDPVGWGKMWGQVHPNYLDEEFYRANHGDQPMLLTSNPYDLAAIKAWAQQPAHETVSGTLAGEELLVIFKN